MNTTGYATRVPLINQTNQAVIGSSFTIYRIENNEITYSIDASTGKPAPHEYASTIISSLKSPSNSMSDWKGVIYYVILDTMEEALDWKYHKNMNIFAKVEKHADAILKQLEAKKKQIGMPSIEDKYPEVIL